MGIDLKMSEGERRQWEGRIGIRGWFKERWFWGKGKKIKMHDAIVT
jgi:hypothetical protein